MPAQILVTASNQQLTAIIKRVAAELGEDIRLVEAVMEDAAAIVRELVDRENIKVVISRSGTAEEIRKAVNVPVISADSTNFDILRAMLEAKKLGSKIGLLVYDHDNFSYDLDTLEEALGIRINSFSYRDLAEAGKEIKKASRNGVEVMVCGGTRAVEWIRQAGMQAVMIANSGQVIRTALLRAREIIASGKKDREQAERLKAIINSSEEGIVGLDASNQISVVNPAAEKMFSVKSEDLIGRPVNSLSAKLPFSQLAAGNEPQMKDLVKAGRHLLVANNVPVRVDREKVGSVLTFRDVTKIQQLEQTIRKELYQKGLIARFCFDDITARSGIMSNVIEKAKRFALTDSTVLILGESGTGKELFAQSIHSASRRKGGPFVAINCAALPQNLLESELFGYDEGAFTGAKKGGKPGLFELAHGGTIFLDEIGKMSMDLQSRLLRVLQEREVMRLGGDRLIPVDIRVIAATNENLWLAVKERTFRNDFFFRLNVLNLSIPPLRKRKEDIPILAKLFIKKFSHQLNKKIPAIPAENMDYFMSYNWPGNVRELENLMERYAILSENSRDNSLLIKELIEETTSSMIRDSDLTYDSSRLIVEIGTLEEMEKQIFAKLLERNKNKNDLALLLNISRTTLWKRLKN